MTGTLREIHHDGAGRVYIHVIPIDADTLETGHDKEEFSLLAEDDIEVLR